MAQIPLDKPNIDKNAVDNWVSLSSKSISNDGKYIAFQMTSPSNSQNKWMIKSTATSWNFEIKHANSFVFTQGNGFGIISLPNNIIKLIKLGGNYSREVNDVVSYKVPEKGNKNWIAYLLNGNDKQLILSNGEQERKIPIINVIDYYFDPFGKYLIVKSRNKMNEDLRLIDLDNFRDRVIFQGFNILNLKLDCTGEQLAFLHKTANHNTELWYYNQSTQKLKLLATNTLNGIDTSLKLTENSDPSFNKTGNKVLLHLYKKRFQTPNASSVKVDIWSFMDESIQYGRKNSQESLNYAVAINLASEKNVQLSFKDDVIFSTFDEIDKMLLVCNFKGDGEERNWNESARPKIYLVDAENGSRILFKQNTESTFGSITLTPKEKFILYYDRQYKDYFSYNIKTGRTTNITNGINPNWASLPDSNYNYNIVSSPAAFFVSDSTVALYDKYDIWKADLLGEKKAVNLTKGFGRANNIAFRLALARYAKQGIKPNSKLFLNAFDVLNKNNGFFELNISHDDYSLKKISLEACFYYAPENSTKAGEWPIEARDANALLLSRERASEYPNLIFTQNFKSFLKITNEQPQKKFNWLSAEILTWKLNDKENTICQGVLYKPENYQSNRKYPVIVHCYETLSDNLNHFPQPGLSYGDINIAWFVSNGYLVFTPDVKYKIGNPGGSAYNSVMTGIEALKRISYVDSTKIGIEGHSWGGYQLNYIITHSNIFKAAVSSSAVSDLISNYGSIRSGSSGPSQMPYYENSQGRMGLSLWERPDLYIDNSPIFNANKVTASVLLMSNKKDPAVDYSQGLEFFLALRRLGKECWILQYDDGGHGVYLEKDQIDFTIRMQQFFDFYLMNKAAPKWMVEGVPANRKGIDNGLELEPMGMQLRPNLLMPEEQQKVDSIMTRTPMLIELK